jgi:hypothetical protein
MAFGGNVGKVKISKNPRYSRVLALPGNGWPVLLANWAIGGNQVPFAVVEFDDIHRFLELA